MGFLDNYRKYKKFFREGKRIVNDPFFTQAQIATRKELKKEPSRTEIINFFIKTLSGTKYLEIGVRNPDHNFNKIACENKYSVDPGLEFKENPATFKMTSDVFFGKLRSETLTIPSNIQFDVIFIDGLHTADQVEKDLQNSLQYLSKDGVIILHDCNPPTEFHQRECFNFKNSPAKHNWNGTTWKAYYKFRHEPSLYSACFDTDWGVAVLSRKQFPAFNALEKIENRYFGYDILQNNRTRHLNLLDFNVWKNKL
ncbi:class I SAM-dependent methyltransferase [Marinirhabdus gelatinilytica]|uniref:Methyltransferase family protein n=1 Tax=Marinirhabdus gelatinilytica TaxID=1703343 RepID=A0A370Q8X4_9FLAO|nr:class I SAM-dependent methyltransferase [Marinirhabdus gelatinilytica]RDK84818.1 methyltransferase family protein [Marinirhabdus gelatinilytica]